MIFLNKNGQPILKKGMRYPQDCPDCPCRETEPGSCSCECLTSLIHQVVRRGLPGFFDNEQYEVNTCMVDGIELRLTATGIYPPDHNKWYDPENPNENYNPHAKSDYEDFLFVRGHCRIFFLR